MLDYPKYEKIETDLKHFSKTNLTLLDKETQEKMAFGELMHYYLETLDLKNPLVENIPTKYQNSIKKFLQSDLLINIKKANVFQEYEFMIDDENSIKHGIIDLLLEYPDHFDIIDYKLKNIDDEAYLKQLEGYKNYLSLIDKRPVNMYLYSIINAEWKKI